MIRYWSFYNNCPVLISDLETSDVNEMVTTTLDPFITKISEHIGLTWKFLAKELGFSQTDIDAIEYKDDRNSKKQINQMFYEWKKREGQNATTNRLLSAIKDAKCADLLKTLREQRIVITIRKVKSKYRYHNLCT